MMYLKQSTNAQNIIIGPFLDSADGNTAKTSLTIANTDILLFKHGASSSSAKNSGGATHIAGGMYYATFDATDTDTVGNLSIFVHVAGALYCQVKATVLSAALYNFVTGSSAPSVAGDAMALTGDLTETMKTSTAAAVLDAALSGHATTGTAGEALARLDATISSRLSGLGASAPAGWINAAAIAANALNGKGDWNTASAPTAAENASAIADLDLIGHTTAGTAGAAWAASGASSDPWSATQGQLAAYPAGSAGRAQYRLGLTPGAGPIATIPAPAVAGRCVAYLNAVDWGDPAAVGAKIICRPEPLMAAAGGFAIDPGRTSGYAMIEVDAVTGYGHREFPVDAISGLSVRFTCERLGLDAVAVIGASGATTFDISTLRANPIP